MKILLQAGDWLQQVHDPGSCEFFSHSVCSGATQQVLKATGNQTKPFWSQITPSSNDQT